MRTLKAIRAEKKALYAETEAKYNKRWKGGWPKELGYENGLRGATLALYAAYMRTRWPEAEGLGYHESYSKEWAERFAAGWEYNCSDSGGQAILRRLAPGVYESKEV